MKSKLENLNCLVLGAGGFLGKNLCRALVEAGASVTGFDRTSCPDELEKSVSWLQGDFSNLKDYARAVDTSDVIFHLVATTVPGTSNSNIEFDIDSNLKNTIKILELFRRTEGKRIIYASSGGAVYGAPLITPTPESNPTNPISSYGIVKLACEKYFSLYAHLYGLDYRILRVANPYGPYQNGRSHQGAVASFLYRAMTDQVIDIWGDGEVVRDYIYVSDVMTAFLAAIEYQGDHRVFNIGSSIGRTLNEILVQIETVTGKKLKVSYNESRKSDVPKIVLDCSLAKQELKWAPSKSFHSGLEETAAWMKNVSQ